MSTTGNVNISGVSGLNAWTGGTALQFGDPNFSLGAGTTNGTFSAFFNVNQFTTADLNIDGANYVRRTVVVGTGANSFALQPGDLLLSIDQDNETLTSLNQLTVNRDDVFVFRPQTAGDYSAGTFFPLLSNFKALTAGGDTRAVALVEEDTVVGDITLHAGSILFAQDGGGFDQDIRLFVPTAVGVGTTAGTVTTLIHGADVNFQPKVLGMDLVDGTTTVGGLPIPAGTLIISLAGNDSAVGSNGLAVTKFDAFTLTVSQTTEGSGLAKATAAMLFQGENVGLNQGPESLSTFSLVVTNSPPVAQSDSYSTANNKNLAVSAASGVLGNDSDPDGDSLTVVGNTAPAHGTVVVNADGSFTYTPTAGYVGLDSFTYTVSDGQGGTATGTVSVTVTAPPGITVTGNSFVISTDNKVYRVNVLTGAVIATYSTSLANDGVAVGPDGSIYVADYANKRIDRFSPTGALILTFSTNGKVPQGLAFGPDGDLYVTTTSNTVERYSPTGSNHVTFIAAGSGGLNNAKAIVWGPDGNAYVSSYFNSEVIRYNGTTGAFMNVFATGTGGFEDLTFGPDGNLYVASYGDGIVYRFAGSNGAALGAFVTGISTAYGLRFDPAGNLDVSSRSTGKILTYSGSTGTLLGTLATGLTNPAYITATTSLVTTNAGGSATYRIVLNSPPAADVTITFSSTQPGQGNLSTTTLTFTAADWNVPQSVTITGLDDGIANGDQVYQINGTASSSDANYNGLALTPVPVVNREVVVNHAPAASNDSYTTAEDAPLTVARPGLLGNDSDVDGDPLTATLNSAPTHGAATVQSDGSFIYAPNANYFGSDQFTYTVSDGRGGTAVGTVSISVTAVNDPPTIDPIADQTVAEGSGQRSVSLTGISAGPGEFQAIAITAVSSDPSIVPDPQIQYSSPAASGHLKFQPAAYASGVATITLTVRDAGFDGIFGDADDAITTQQFKITVTPINHPPVAAPDAYSEIGLLSLSASAASGVLANDSDPDNDPITAALVSGPSKGTLILQPDGSFTYTPALLFTGTDAFTYQAKDPSGALSSPATVTITVGLGNGAPVAADDSYSIDEDTALNGSSVLANDTDPNGDPITAHLVSSTAHGSFTLHPDGTFTYAPHANFNGSDSITYQAFDGQAYSNTATVTITVNPVNDPPVAANDSASVDEDNAVTIGVLANDTDVDGDPLLVISVAQAAHGAVTTDGTIVTYTPNANFFGSDSFVYTVGDGNGGLASATVSVTVNPVNDPPTLDAIADQTVAEDCGAQSISLGGITAGPGETDALTVTAVSSNPSLIPNPTIAYSSPNSTGTLIFNPSANGNGSATIAVTVGDGMTTFSRTFTITVTPVDDAPTITPIADQTIAEDTSTGPLAFAVADVDTSPGNLTVTAKSSDQSMVPNANLVLSGAGVNRHLDVTPAANANGQVTITLRVSDRQDSTTESFVLTITPVNDPPLALADFFVTDQDTDLVVGADGVLANDTDVDGDSLSAKLLSAPSNGTVIVHADGSFAYQPNPGFEGSDQFRYEAVDPSGAISAATVHVQVIASTGKPSAADDVFTVDEDTKLSVAATGVLGNDTSPSASPLTAELVKGAHHGTVKLAADGSFVYKPDPNFNGKDWFAYQARDVNGASNTAVVVIVVTPVNDPPKAVADEYKAVAGATLSVGSAGGLLANDSDPDGDRIFALLARRPAHGTVKLHADGSFAYTPEAGYTGKDVFWYKTTDRIAESDATQVLIHVRAQAAPTPVSGTTPEPIVPPPIPVATGSSSGNPTSSDSERDGGGSAHSTLPVALPVPLAVMNGPSAGTASSSFGHPAFFASTPLSTFSSRDQAPNLPAWRNFDRPPPSAAAATRQAPPTSSVPEPVEAMKPALVSPPRVSSEPSNDLALPPISRGHPPRAEAVVSGLNELDRQVHNENGNRAVGEIVVASGVVASAGYVLLSPRLALWLIGAAVARKAVWKPFDPLEVVYSWENDERNRKQDEEDDSLQNMVDK
jgi:large repetitive protein